MSKSTLLYYVRLCVFYILWLMLHLKNACSSKEREVEEYCSVFLDCVESYKLPSLIIIIMIAYALKIGLCVVFSSSNML